VNGELALESIAVDGQSQHEPQSGIHGASRDGAKVQRAGGPEAVGVDSLDLLVVSHAVGIGANGGDL
jgi:hypothetical protein